MRTKLLEQSFKDYVNSYYPLEDKKIEKLLSIAQLRNITEGSYIVNVGDIARSLYFVVQGVLVSEYITEDNKLLYKNFFVANNYAASTVSMITQEPSEFGIIAITDCTILSFNYAQYQNLIQLDIELLKFYIAYLEKNWVIINESRHIAFATQTATQRYLTFLKEYPFLSNQVSQKHIASYLGVTPTQLSRIRKELTA